MEELLSLVKFDHALDALGDVRRRELLLALLDRDSHDDPPIVVAGPGSGLEASADAVALRHTHLPKLAEHGLVEWDLDENEVRRGPAFAEIQPMLELLDAHADNLPDGWS